MKFRKKPVVIEARRWDGGNIIELQEWAHAGQPAISNAVITYDGFALSVRTLGGRIYANGGDMIVKGIAGEFYPVKPEIFEATYEAV
jgi:hypothetical protein